MGNRRPHRWLRSLALPALALVTLGASLQAGPTLEDWSRDLWNSAKRGDGTTVSRLSDSDALAGTSIGGDLRTFNQRAADREQVRRDRLDELKDELDVALDGNDLEEALRVLLEQQDLQHDPRDFTRRPEVQSVVQRAAERAHALEDDADWLPAFRLFSMLHVLHEVDRTYEEDWRRLGQRRAMIGFYSPQTLYDMVSDERVANGDPPLPPYNQSGPTWRERVAGLNSDMVATALKRAADRHIDEVPVRDMLKSGFAALRVLATTPEVAHAMPELEDADDVKAFVEQLDVNRMAIDRLDGELGFHHIDNAMRILARMNSETVGLPMEVLLHEFGNGAASSLDEYSQFYWPESIERANRTTQGNFKGVGIQIVQNEDLELEVVTPVAGTPAFRAGVRPGDVIAEIEGEPALGLGTNDAVDRITGPAGTSVTLGVRRDGEDELLTFTLNREVIKLHAARGWERNGPDEEDWDWFIDKEAGIGYVRLSQFLNGASQETRDAVRAMKRQGLNGIILDLRYNPGGLLNEAVDLTNLFINGGIVVTQEDADGTVQDVQRARRGFALIEDIPVVVLVNGGSASASEIVSGALQDHGRAVLVGSRTYGKGSVQRIFPLDRFGRAAFKLTTQYYKLPSGRLIHRRPGDASWGIEPDVVVEMMPSEIGDALQLRRDADVITTDEQGNVIAETADPTPLVTEGLDPQLETAVLLLRAKVMGDQLAHRDVVH